VIVFLTRRVSSWRTTYFGGVMRLLPFMFGIICVGIIGIGTPAAAGVQNYPWCAIYSDGAVGAIYKLRLHKI
jgi:hypothetical protein